MKQLFLIISIALFSFSCQQEIEEIIEPTPDEVLEKGGSLSSLIQALTTRDGSDDNIIDMSSCTSLKLPFRAIVNGEEIEITSASDFDEIEKILDRYEDDDDLIEILFPIILIYPDHSEYEVQNEDEFEDIIEACETDLVDLDIECIDFKYPISVSVYDTENQVAQVIDLNSDEEFYSIIDDLEDEDLVSINFPLTVILSDGTEQTITNNAILQDVIDTAEGTCDEDDDNDFDDDDVSDDEIRELLLDGTWAISSFLDGEDKTQIYSDYEFSFFVDDLAIARKDNEDLQGEWETYGDAGIIEFEWDFEEVAELEGLEKDWTVVAFGDEQVDLVFTDDGEEASLVLVRIGDSTPVSANEVFKNILFSETWQITSYIETEQDLTSSFEEISFQFEEDGLLVAEDEETGEEYTGNWSVAMIDQNLTLEIAFEAEPLAGLSDDWKVVQTSENTIELVVENQTGLNNELVFESI